MSVQEALKKIPESVQKIADTIEANVNIDKNLGVISEAEPSSVYYQTLPEGLTPELVNQHDRHNKDFVTANNMVIGRIGLQVLADNKKLDVVTSNLAMGNHSSIAATLERSRDYTLKTSGEAQTITKHGVVTPVYETLAGRNDAANKHSKAYVNELFGDYIDKAAGKADAKK